MLTPTEVFTWSSFFAAGRSSVARVEAVEERWGRKGQLFKLKQSQKWEGTN